MKMYVLQTMHLESDFWIPPNWPETGKLMMMSQFSNITSIFSRFFYVVFPVKFSYWSKFDVNIFTGSGVMAIYFYQGLTRNLVIGNTSIQVLPTIWRLGWVRDNKFDTDVKWNVTKCWKMPGLQLFLFLSY